MNEKRSYTLNHGIKLKSNEHVILSEEFLNEFTNNLFLAPIFIEQVEEIVSSFNSGLYSLDEIININDFLKKKIDEANTDSENENIKLLYDILNEKFDKWESAFRFPIKKETEGFIKANFYHLQFLKNFQADIIPEDILFLLKKEIVGNDDLLILVSNCCFIHSIRAKLHNLELPGNTLMIIGPPGSGKTEIAKIISRRYHYPFVSVSASEMVSEGIVGFSKSDIFKMLYKESGGDISKAESGIVFIDEIDKIGRKGVYSVSVQQQLLSVLNKDDVRFRKSFNKDDEFIQMSTKKIWFILAGAFTDVDFSNNTASIGFNASQKTGDTSSLMEVQEKLVKQGFSREFISRINFFGFSKTMNNEQFKYYIKHADKSPFVKYQNLFCQYKINICIHDDVLEEIAKMVIGSNMGARFLETVFFDLFRTHLANIGAMPEGLVITIDLDYYKTIYK